MQTSDCRVCATAKYLAAVAMQLVKNLLLISDKLVNSVLLGDPNETLSRRVARANEASERWAHYACRALNIISPNHCAWSLRPGSIGREVWPWSAVDEAAQKVVVAPQPHDPAAKS